MRIFFFSILASTSNGPKQTFARTLITGIPFAWNPKFHKAYRNLRGVKLNPDVTTTNFAFCIIYGNFTCVYDFLISQRGRAGM
jgi:hypothetical protein